MQRAVFLDRDGTLTRDAGYTHRVEDYALLPGVPQALARLAGAGYRLVITTNQSGIGRGFFSREAYREFHAHLIADLAGQGVVIDASYYCPHHPDEGCSCRKPATGMLERAARERDLDLSACWVIGDSARDVALAERLGLRGGVLVLTGRGRDEDPDVAPHVERAADLADAAEHILAADGPPAG